MRLVVLEYDEDLPAELARLRVGDDGRPATLPPPHQLQQHRLRRPPRTPTALTNLQMNTLNFPPKNRKMKTKYRQMKRRLAVVGVGRVVIPKAHFAIVIRLDLRRIHI